MRHHHVGSIGAFFSSDHVNDSCVITGLFMYSCLHRLPRLCEWSVEVFNARLIHEDTTRFSARSVPSLQQNFEGFQRNLWNRLTAFHEDVDLQVEPETKLSYFKNFSVIRADSINLPSATKVWNK